MSMRGSSIHITTRVRGLRFVDIALSASIVIAILCNALAAHPVHVQHGEIRLDDHRVEVRFPISAHDTAHFRESIDEIADNLIRNLYIFDQTGVLLHPECTTHDEAGCSMTFTVDDDVRYLTFQQRVESNAISQGRLMQFNMTRGDLETLPSMRLSAGGNAETIPLRSGSSVSESKQFDRFHELLLIVTPGDSAVELEVYVPAPLLETWLPVRRKDSDVLTIDELDQCKSAIAEWLTSRLTAEGAGVSEQVEVHRIVLLGPTSDCIADLPQSNGTSDPTRAETNAVGYWCARIGVQATLKIDKNSNEIALRCALFNSRVLTMQTVVVAGGSRQWQKLSTYEPVLRLPVGPISNTEPTITQAIP